MTILANQIKNGTIDDALFITVGAAEYIQTERFLDEICGLQGCWIFDEQDVVVGVTGLLNDKCFDDVLISPAVHDPILRNYLSHHCRRILKNYGD